MAHKAFAQIIAIYASGQVSAQYVVLNEDGTPSNYPYNGNANTQLEYSDTSQSIHEKLADDIRTHFTGVLNGLGPILDIVVIFPDAPGRF